MVGDDGLIRVDCAFCSSSFANPAEGALLSRRLPAYDLTRNPRGKCARDDSPRDPYPRACAGLAAAALPPRRAAGAWPRRSRACGKSAALRRPRRRVRPVRCGRCGTRPVRTSRGQLHRARCSTTAGSTTAIDYSCGRRRVRAQRNPGDHAAFAADRAPRASPAGCRSIMCCRRAGSATAQKTLLSPPLRRRLTIVS